MATLREASKGNWNTDIKGSATDLEIQSGSLQRIADACELMAKNYFMLISERDDYQKRYSEQREKNGRLYRRIAALHGVITKLKRGSK